MPATWAIPLVSGCKTKGKTKPCGLESSSAFSRASLYKNSNRDFQFCSIVAGLTNPCEFSAAGRNCIGVISSIYQLQGISTRVSGVLAAGRGRGFIQVEAEFQGEKSMAVGSGILGMK
jgi:hypothetical protein